MKLYSLHSNVYAAKYNITPQSVSSAIYHLKSPYPCKSYDTTLPESTWGELVVNNHFGDSGNKIRFQYTNTTKT